MSHHLGRVGDIVVELDNGLVSIHVIGASSDEDVSLTRIEASFLSDLLHYAAGQL